jgi:SP family general alpha glucoside:H+ symporter-like MFS transporter
VALIAIIFDATFIDKIGRRRMCIVGFTGCCVGVMLISIIGLLDYTTKTMGALLVFAAVFARFFNNLQNSTIYAFLNEVPDQRLKARSAGWDLAYANL